MSNGTFLYPNVTSLPSQSGVSQTERQDRAQKGTEAGREFEQVFDQALENIRAPLKFSAHATQRLKDRKIALDPMTLTRVRDAVDKAEAKGVEDTLILTSNAALIVNVKNRTVITALDRGSASGNVFTNIDGAVVI